MLEQKKYDFDITEAISQNSIKENEQTPVLVHQINNYNHQQDFQMTNNTLKKSDKELVLVYDTFTVLRIDKTKLSLMNEPEHRHKCKIQ